MHGDPGGGYCKCLKDASPQSYPILRSAAISTAVSPVLVTPVGAERAALWCVPPPRVLRADDRRVRGEQPWARIRLAEARDRRCRLFPLVPRTPIRAETTAHKGDAVSTRNLID